MHIPEKFDGLLARFVEIRARERRARNEIKALEYEAQAASCRKLAEQQDTPWKRAVYLVLADGYDKFAREYRKIGRQ